MAARDAPAGSGQISLCFSGEGEEARFKASLKPAVRRSVLPVCCLCIGFSVAGIVSTSLEASRADNPFTFELADPRMLCFLGQVVAVAMAVVGLALVCGSVLFTRIRNLDWEAIMIGLTLPFIMIIIPVTSKGLVASLHGVDPAGVWMHEPENPELVMVVSMDLVMSFICACSPVRVRISWLLQASSIVTFVAVVIAIGCPDIALALQSFASLACFAIFSHMSMRCNERNLRKQWIANQVCCSHVAATQTSDDLQSMVRSEPRSPPTMMSSNTDVSEAARCGGRPPLLPKAKSRSSDSFDSLSTTCSKSTLTSKPASGTTGSHRRRRSSPPSSGTGPDVPQELGDAESLDIDSLGVRGLQQRWMIHTDSIKLMPDTIAEGRKGKLTLGDFNGTPVAVRISTSSSNRMNLSVLPSIAQELQSLRLVAHPNIGRFHGAIILPNSLDIALVYEKVSGVRLNTYLEALPSPSLSSRLDVNLDICRALRFLHLQTPHVVHGDLKPSNVMISSCACCTTAIIVDIGVHRLQKQQVMVGNISLQWAAPGVLQGCEQTSATLTSDVLSFGRILASLLTGKSSTCHLDRHTEMEFQEVWPDVPSALLSEAVAGWRDLFARCTCNDEAQRPCMTGVQDIVEALTKITGHFASSSPDCHAVTSVATLHNMTCSM